MSSTSAGIQVVDFIAALSKAWKKLSAYPPGHPEVTGALEVLTRRMAELRGPAGEVVLGVGASSLVYGTLDITSPGAQKLAHALYSRGVAVVRLGNETSREEIEIFLRILGSGGPVDPRRVIWEELTAAGVININLQPVTYGKIQVTEGVQDTPREERSLWDEVLRALLHDQQFSAFVRDAPVQVDSADELAQMIAKYAATPADAPMPIEEEATFGIRLGDKTEEAFHRFFFQTVGHHLATVTAVKRQNSLEQAVQLLRGLPDQLRRPLILAIAEALAADESSGALLRDFATELPTDEVLDALRYLSSIEGMSSHSLRLLRSLTSVEASKSEAVSEDVLSAVIELFGEEDVARINPTEYDGTLATFSAEIPRVPSQALNGLSVSGTHLDPVVNADILRHFSEVLLDVLHDPAATAAPLSVLKRLEESFPPLLAAEEYEFLDGVIHRLLAIESSDPPPRIELLSPLHDSLARISRVVVEVATSASEEQMLELRPLIDSLDVHARQSFLDSLTTESNRSRRRRLLNFIAAQGPAIVPQVIAYLGDERWYVVRNMIVLLRAVKDVSSLPEIRKLARHPDLRVRMEAIKSLFAMDANVPQTLLDNLFNDVDPKVGQTAVTLSGSYGIAEAVDPLLRLLHQIDYFGTKRVLRVKAIRALGEIGEPRALKSLHKFFATPFLPWPSKEERYAAWESLTGYPYETRKQLVASGMKSADARIREICSRLRSA